MASVDKEPGDPLLRALRGLVDSGRHEDDEEVRMFRAGNEVLGSVHDPVAPVADRRALHAANVGASIRLGHCQRVHSFAADSRQEVALPLVSIARHQDLLGSSEEMREGHGTAPQFPLHEREIDMGKPGATHLLREIAGIESEVDDLVPDLVAQFARDMPSSLDLGLVGVDLVFDKAPDGGDDHLLLFVQPEFHVLAPLVRPAVVALLPFLNQAESDNSMPNAKKSQHLSADAGSNCEASHEQ